VKKPDTIVVSTHKGRIINRIGFKEENKINKEKIEQLFKDEKIIEAFKKTETADDAQKLLSDNGIDVSMEDLIPIYDKIKEEASEELSMETLELVAGGLIRPPGARIPEPETEPWPT